MAKPRVHEIAKEIGITSKELLKKLTEMGEYVSSASSTLEAPVVRRVREAYAPKAETTVAKPAAPKPSPTKPTPRPAGGKDKTPSEPVASKPVATPELQPRLPRPVRQSPYVRFPNLPRVVRAPNPGRLARARPHLNSRLPVPERPLVQEATSPHPKTVPDPVLVPVQGPVPVAPHPPPVHMRAVPAPRVPATIRSRFPKEWALGVPERSDVTRAPGRVVTSECRVPVALAACPAPTPR